MFVIRLKSFAASRADSLCATCLWGTVRKGFSEGQVETFCRLVSPNNLVPFVIRECTDYSVRRVPCETAEAKSTDRRFGFVTTLTLGEADAKSSP
jgi:hypothetical protein